MIRKPFFLLVAFIATVTLALGGCGIDGTQQSSTDTGLIIGGTDALETIPEVGIYKTTVTRGDQVETTFQLETETPVTKDLVVYVLYDNGEGEFIVIRKGQYRSETFEFIVNDTVVNTVTLQADHERVKVSLPKLAKNSEKIEVTIGYNYKMYPYNLKETDVSVSR